MPNPSGTVTLLFSDIEGSTLLWEFYAKEMAVALKRHDELMRAAVEATDGFVFKTVGDAFCVAFADETSCAKAALRAQDSLQLEMWPQGIEIRVRMALHTGTCQERDDDYFGPTVNRTARLMAIAHGGQTIVSGVTAELLSDLPLEIGSFRDLGQHRLRDLGRPEHVWQLDAPSTHAEFPPLRSLDNPDLPNNLPDFQSTFFGREREMAEVRALIESARLVTLTGAGGSGKTRLALHTAAELLDGTGDGVWFVEFASITDEDQVPLTIAAVLGIRKDSEVAPLRTVVDALSTQNILLVLDNCEHLVTVCATLAETVLRHCPRVHLVVTSREPLGVDGERVYRIPSMSLPSGDVETLEDLSDSDAVALFLGRARDVDYLATDETAPLVASICQQLDGIPLALELAAARLSSMSLSQLSDRLDQRFRLLTGGSRNALARQQTLQAMVDWSYELLSPAEQSVLRSLSVFAGGFDLDAAESVCSSESVDEVEVANLLHSLVAKSLIVADKVATAVRFRLLETIRQFGAQELLRSGGEGEVFATRDRHAAYYVALAQISKQKMRGPEDRTWGPRLGQEMGNIRSALAHLANDPARAEDVLVIFTSLRDFLRVRDHADIIAFLRDAIEYFEGVSSPLVAEALFCAADLIGWHFSGDTTQLNLSWSLALRGLEMATQLNIPRLRALGLSDMAYHSYQLDFDGALLLLEEALLIADQSGDISLRFEVHLRANREAMGLARCRTIEGQIEEAHRILGFARQLGVTAFIGSAKVELAFHYEAQTNYEASERYYLESIALFEEIGADSFVHLQRGNLVYVLLPQGKFDESEQIVRQWLRKVRRGGLQIETSHIVLAAGCIAAWRGDYIRAARLLGAHSVQGPAGIARGLMIYTETDLQGESAFRDLVREVLGDEIFDREHSAGAFLTVSEATELALGRIVVL